MKKILLITNIYPMPDKNYDGTPVCHFFTREWLKMGYDVRVVHFESLFPSLYYWASKGFKNLIQAKTGCVAYMNTPRVVQKYQIEDVPVLFVPMSKYIPHTMFSKAVTDKAINIVCDDLKAHAFVPDVIVGHFVLPQLKMLYLLKQKFPNAVTGMVLHSEGSTIPKLYSDYQKLMTAVDVWGFRSEAFKLAFEAKYGKKEKEFICYSGIPAKYLTPIEHDFSQGIRKFSFVGSLYKLKRVDDTLQALKKVFVDKHFSFDIVGSGAEFDNLKALSSSLGISDCVKFHGQKTRDDAQKIMGGTDCFIMVSAHEAFGLVYVEAMAKGCITIATKGQGIDGVIIDGENGFLCEAENPDALADVITYINSLPVERLRQISLNAIKTAENLTDEKVAKHYIDSLI